MGGKCTRTSLVGLMAAVSIRPNVLSKDRPSSSLPLRSGQYAPWLACSRAVIEARGDHEDAATASLERLCKQADQLRSVHT